MQLRLTLLVTSFLFLSKSFGQAPPVIQLSEDVEQISVGEGVLVLTDSAGTLSLEQALAGSYLPSEDENISYGPSPYTYWMRFDIASGRSDEDLWMLEFGYPLLDSVSFWLFLGDSLVSEQEYGDLKPFSERPVDYRRIAIPLNLVHDQHYSVVIRVRTESSYQLGM
ncbi:MAG: 7TM-DISM domain-containing protein, partial [Bacteroidota bacterium]